MKVVIIVILIIAAVALGQNYLETGKIGFNTQLTEAEKTLRSLDERLNDALRGYRVAGRGGSIGGMVEDSTAEVMADRVLQVEKELKELADRVGNGEEKDKVRELQRRVAAAKSEIGIP